MKFRRRPVVVDAIQYTGENGAEIQKWSGGAIKVGRKGLLIWTLEGSLWAAPGDWIIKGVEGEFYPCKPSIFEKVYEPEGRERR